MCVCVCACVCVCVCVCVKGQGETTIEKLHCMLKVLARMHIMKPYHITGQILKGSLPLEPNLPLGQKLHFLLQNTFQWTF